MIGNFSEIANSAAAPCKKLIMATQSADRALFSELTDSKSSPESRMVSGLNLVSNETKLGAEGTLKGAVINPVNGIAQLVNKTMGANLPKLELSNDKGVENSLSGNIGEVAGAILGFVLTDGAVGTLCGIKSGTALSLGITGTIEGGVLQSSDPKKEGVQFLVDRVKNAGIQAATCATMGGVSQRLASTFEASSASFANRVANSTIKNSIAGAAGGLVNAETTSILHEGRIANPSEIGRSVLWNAAFGAGIGALSEGITTAFETLKPAFKTPELSDAERLANRARLEKMIDKTGTISSEFAARVVKGLENTPQYILERFESEGVRIKLGATLPEIMDPQLLSFKPRGHNPQTDFSNFEGAYDPNSKSILIAETYNAVMTGTRILSDRCEGVSRHEAGHGVDQVFSDLSSSSEFRAAHSVDVSNIPKSMHKKLNYYILSDIPGAGASEAFADLFALMYGGPCNKSDTLRLSRNFPESMKAMVRRLKTEEIRRTF